MPKKQKFFSKKTAIIAGVVLFALIVPNFCHALFGIDGESIAQSIMAWVTHIILSFFSLFVDLAARFLEAMLNIGFASHKDVVEIGWKIVRDFSNMFFILFMVIIAFATILRIERYGIKELLPKVIIIALLINFSLVICYLIIDFSDIAAHYFINSAKQGLSGQQSIATVLRDGLNLTKVMIPNNCDDTYQQSMQTCALFTNPIDIAACAAAASTALNTCKTEQDNLAKTTNQEGNFINMVISTIFGSIILMIAAFILFVGGILIVVRLFFLWFLVMLVPFVFLCYLMPALRGNWQKWWRSFLSWCFFAPIYCFFIWLAIKLILEKRINQTIGVTGDAGNQTLGTAFFGTTDNLIAYLFTAALLIGGLIAAKQMGIYGANIALTVGQKWGRGAKDWAKRTSMRPVKYVASQAGGAITAGAGKLFGGKFGRRLEAKGYQIKARAAEERVHKAYAAMLGTMSNENLKEEVKTAKGIRRIIATREAQKRGILREADRDTVKKASEAMRAYGATDVARQLEELRPDAIKEKDRRREAIERAIKEGTHKKWSKEVFEGLEGQEIVAELQRQLAPSEFADVFKGWATDIKERAEIAMRSGFTDKFDVTTEAGKENRSKREAFAKATGKVNQAFFGDATGNIKYGGIPEAEKQAENHIKSLNDEGIGKLYLKDEKNKIILARYMTTSQVEGAGAKLSGADKQFIKQQLEGMKDKPDRKEVLEQVNRSIVWGGSAPLRTVDLREGRITKEEAEEKLGEEFQKYKQEKKKKTGSITDESITD